jgi:hypothetical protein
MRIDLRDTSRTPLGRITLDPSLRPTRVLVSQQDQSSSQREVFLNWDAAIDDAGRLRACVSCGCRDLFREKSFPAVTAIIVLLAFLGSAVGLLGLTDTTLKQLGLVVILLVDVALLVFSRSRLVCYRCRTSYRGLQIARYHRPWDRSTSDRYPVTAASRPESAELKKLSPEQANSTVAAGTGISVSRPAAPIKRTIHALNRLFRGPSSPSSPAQP